MLNVVILAAGQGKRMNPTCPKYYIRWPDARCLRMWLIRLASFNPGILWWWWGMEPNRLKRRSALN